MRNISLFFASLFALASWLMPNHYSPWLSFHGEMMMGLALFVVLVPALWGGPGLSLTLPRMVVATAFFALVPLLQNAFGLIRFAGDAWMVMLFLLSFALAQVAGQRLSTRFSIEVFFDVMAGLFVTAAICSVGLQLYQWLGLHGLGVFAVELAPRHPPYANVSQPNHLATMLFLAIVGVLYLHQRAHIRLVATAVAIVFIQFGLAMTASRTAWLLMTLLVVTLLLARRRFVRNLSVSAIVALSASFLLLLVLWPLLNDLMLLSPGRSFSVQSQVGPRPLLWATMLDAIAQQPVLGYGWNQGLVAQDVVVDRHPANGRLISNSHNLVLDLMVWNGIPLGLLIAGLLAMWFWRSWQESKNAVEIYILLAVTGVFLHAMLEFPLSYLYFLLPVGLMMGALDSERRERMLSVPLGSVSLLGALTALLGAAVVYEYVEVEANTRTLQFEKARIGTDRIQSSAPELRVLTQWSAFLQVARIEPTVGMSPDELARMHEVVERFPYSGIQLTVATADGLNGRSAEAERMLSRLCRLHTKRNCHVQLTAWSQLVEKHPVLKSVQLPEGHR
jgi:O-antigen ligase